MADKPTGADWNTPEYWERLDHIFRSHFGYLSDARREREASMFGAHIVEPPRAWNRKSELEKLTALQKALRHVRSLNLAGGVAQAFYSDAIRRSRAIDSDAPFDGVSDADFSDALRRSRGANEKITPFDAAIILDDLYDLLTPSIEAAKVEVERGDTLRRKWEGVTAIEACRVTWLRCTRNEAPISLDEAGPFGAFVGDVFDLHNMRSPRSAMASWAKYQNQRKNIP